MGKIKHRHPQNNPRRETDRGLGGYWSETFQWLPANLAFQEDGTVKFTSYINNLHPKKYPDIYRLIEKVVDMAIPAWDRVLSSTITPQKRFDLPPEVE